MSDPFWSHVKYWLWYSWAYRPLMRQLHRWNWHHCKVCWIEGDVMDWCDWCGMRYVRPKEVRVGSTLRVIYPENFNIIDRTELLTIYPEKLDE